MKRLSEPVRVAFERLIQALGEHVAETVWEQSYYVWLRGRRRNLRVHTSIKGKLEIGLHPASGEQAAAFLRDYADLGLTPKVQAGYRTSPFVRPEIGPSFPDGRLVAMFAAWLDGAGAEHKDR
jgi:hypothetical protein